MSHYQSFGCIAYEQMTIGSGLPPAIDMGDGQRVVFAPPIELNDFWRTDLGNYQFGHLSKSNFAIELALPEGEQSYDNIASRLWGTFYAILLLGMPRFIGGLEILGTRYENGVTVHKVLTPYLMYHCPRAKPALLSGNIFMKAKAVAAGLREIHAPSHDFVRLRRGFLAWMAGVRAELGETRLHQFVRAVEAVIKPGRDEKTGVQFVRRSGLFTTNGDLLDELFNLRSTTEHMNDYSAILTEDSERRGWYRSFQAELLAQTVYTRILSNPQLLSHFRSDVRESRPLRELNACLLCTAILRPARRRRDQSGSSSVGMPPALGTQDTASD